MKRDPNDRTVLRELLRGVYGSPAEWKAACYYAVARGWTPDECQSVLFWCHPLMLMIGAVVIGTAALLIVGAWA